MSIADDLRSLADSYQSDSHALRGMDQEVGYGLSNEQWAIVYHTVAIELYNMAEVAS